MNNFAFRLPSPYRGFYPTGADGAHSKQMRLAFLGTLAAVLAHDYANIFQGILLRLACMKKNGEIRPSDLAAIERQLTHAAHRAEQLSKFINGADNVGRFTSIDLRETIDDAIELIEWRQSPNPDGQKKYTIHRELAYLPPILGSVGEMVFLFVNLLMNACEAMPDGGIITISGRAEESEVVIAIADQGTGIPYGLLAKMFDEFVTTKSSGSGWGLFMASELMRRLGGSIAAQNRPAGGALFTLRFPCSTQSWGSLNCTRVDGR
jgi:signal transduction histidine kinase